jgi:hypothetical protein
MALVRDDWSRHAGFQRVRSTVEIFALTAYHWLGEHRAGRWAPRLIGVGDIPLTVALEQVLSSGLLHGNERAVQGFRQVAAADIVSKDATKGRANELDGFLTGRGVDAAQPHPALRMATALYCYSLVPRTQAKRGATKAELLSAVYAPGVPFHAVDEVFNALTDTEEGLGALERTEATGGSAPARFHLAITQTLRMFLKQAKGSIQPLERDAYLWERTKALASRGPFDEVIPVAMPPTPGTPIAEVFAEVDQNATTRLVVLDPRQWTLLNGRDIPTRGDIIALLGVGEHPLPVDNAASCVIACVNAQRRDAVRKRATEALAWRAVLDQLEPSDDKFAEADTEHKEAAKRVDDDLLKAYQYYAYLIRTDRAEVDWRRFDDDTKSSLKGSHVWEALTEHDRATLPGKLSGTYLRTLLERTPRALTLKEVTQQFYKNPAYPMVPSVDDIRRAVYDLVTGIDRYEIVDASSEVLTITSADELSIGSMDQLLRKPAVALPGETSPADDDTAPGTHIPQPTPEPTGDYRRYMLEIPHRSLADPDARRLMANLLQAVLDAVDPDTGGDLQLIDVHVNITADPTAVEEVSKRAAAARAKWHEEELDF